MDVIIVTIVTKTEERERCDARGTKMGGGQQTRNRGWTHRDSEEFLNGYDKGTIALPSNCNQPEAASSETPLPSVHSLTTSSRDFVIFVYQTPSNSPASTGSVLPPPALPPSSEKLTKGCRVIYYPHLLFYQQLRWTDILDWCMYFRAKINHHI